MVLGLPRPSLCVWFSLTQLPTEAARKLFLYHFLKEMAKYLSFSGFSNLFNASARLFVPYLLPSHVKYYPNSQNFPPF